MSWGDPEVKQEKNWDKYFTTPGVVYFAAAGDSGLGVSIYPGASPNVVAVGAGIFWVFGPENRRLRSGRPAGCGIRRWKLA